MVSIAVNKTTEAVEKYERVISHSGHRLTRQRREVFDVLLQDRDHPTATEVFLRTKRNIPGISLATVYNCLETLVECGLVRQVHFEREPTRFCPNLHEHGHFICSECGEVLDVPIKNDKGWKNLWQLPRGTSVTSVEVTLRGVCGKCRTKTNGN